MAETTANDPASAARAKSPGDPRRTWQRLLPDSLGTWVIVVLMAVVILVNGSSLVFFALFRDDAAVAAAAGQAADQIVTIARLVERARPADRPLLMRRLNSPVMGLVSTRKPIVTTSDDRVASRVVLRRLQRVFPESYEIRVDSRIEFKGSGGEAFPSPDEIRRHMESESDANADASQGGEGDLALDFPVPPPIDALPPDHEKIPGMRAFERRIGHLLRQQAAADPNATNAVIRVSVGVAPERWFNARVMLAVGGTPEQFRPYIIQAAITVLIALITLWGLRRATKPLYLFVGAAERLGVDVNAQPLDENGPGEVRRAARAFNTMQTRLKRFIQDRTQMLAAISHDLRTPITRMKLRAEFVDDDEQREKMLKDLAEMEAMIATTLAFARDDAANETAEIVDVGAMLTRVVADERAAGRDAKYDGPGTLEIMARPLALKRAFVNLIDNALKYGTRVRVGVAQQADELEILFDDDGAGIAESDQERVFAPFFRLEASRSRETGGTGLGLTITRNAIRSMGGDIQLINRRAASGEVAGLRVRVTLPVARPVQYSAE
ncbi:MAG: HAMP domain-containing protein [Rhodobacteraceae bacterium]|nr:HAMP domain-containing protein [Paracoccaceae bacterium]